MDTPAVTRKLAIATKHSVARDDDSEWICRARLRNSADGSWPANGGRDFGVTGCCASWDCTQGGPDIALKSGAVHVECGTESGRWRFDAVHHFEDNRVFGTAGLDESCTRESFLQIVEQLVAVIAQEDRAHADVGLSDQYEAQ
ncbi:MAG TPA: hypothetical protein VIG47_09170 [Gemmatimonadaceae bacterium]